MRRLMDRRDDGFELFELSAIDDLDFEHFVPMVDEAWKNDYRDQVRQDFDEAVLRKLAGGSCWVGVLACTADGAPVGFELALERTLRVGDRSLRAFYATSFTVSLAHRRRGLGSWVLEGINRLVFDRHGADLIISTLHQGHAGSPTVQSTFDRIQDWSVLRFHSASIWSRRLDRDPLPAQVAAPEWTVVAPQGGSIGIDAVDRLVRSEFEVSFGLDKSLAEQYLNPDNEASGLLTCDLGGDGVGIAGFNIMPASINDKRLRPIGQLQFLLAPGGDDAVVEHLVWGLADTLAARGCFAMSLLDTGMVPVEVLEKLGFSETEDTISFAVRGPRAVVELFADVSPPLFLDFT